VSSIASSDRAAEQVRDLPADRQAEAGAAVLAAGGAVGLLEGLEDDPAASPGDADAGVGDPRRRRRAASASSRRSTRLLGHLDAQLDVASAR
jgi:hypothetical protein